jgi:hypothetical protein
MVEPIATETLLVQSSGEAPFEVVVQIGRPYQDPEYPDEWVCPLSLTPLHSKLSAARSNSAVQSLCLAISLALDLLYAVVEKGGSVSLAPGAPLPFEAYAFGIAARQRREKDS